MLRRPTSLAGQETASDVLSDCWRREVTSTKLNLTTERTLAEKKTSLQNYPYNYKKEILRGISDFLLRVQV